MDPDGNATVSESDGCSVATARGDRALGLLAWALFALVLGRRRRA
jgi:MYXO-CTERM domain-containing protein